MNDLLLLSPSLRQVINGLVTAGSVLACLLILPTRLAGMELLGVGPNWLLIWVVAWSIKRSPWQGALAGITLGLLQDGLTSASPTHTLSLALVGILTALIQKQRYIQEDFISVALIVFGMAVIAETVTAFQFMFQDLRLPDRLSSRTLSEIWNYHQQIALCSAILSSLWAPALYYPLNRWWQRVNMAEQLQS
ncbi:MAG: rod shape-determining protein MreD [Cyanobacteria bacterium J069]|nr:MAG: rod shape-determining protein MreD [Cyanobacteria bacterium J069]